jgi:hypothetical protein
MVSPIQPDTRPSLDNQTTQFSKSKSSSKNSVHLSAVSTSNSMEPPAPPPPPPPVSGGSSRNTGEKNPQIRQVVPPSPVLLRIDASDQGRLISYSFQWVFMLELFIIFAFEYAPPN